MTLNGKWTTENGFCAKDFPLYVPTDNCEYLVTKSGCDDCPEFTNRLPEGQLAIVDRHGKILNPTTISTGDFHIAMGGRDGWNTQSLLINRKSIKSVTSSCPTDRQAEKWRILFDDVQCGTNYTLSFTATGDYIMTTNNGTNTTYQSVTARTGCCESCDTTGNAVELAKKLVKKINTAAYCNKNFKNRYIKATVICTPTTILIPDPELCPANDCVDCITTPASCVSKTYAAGIEIEGLFYDEYCSCCAIKPTVAINWDGVSIEPYFGSRTGDGSWECNTYMEKVQDLRYSTGDGCQLAKLEFVWNREKFNPTNPQLQTEYFHPSPVDTGIITCECNKKYCVIEIVSYNHYTYESFGRDIHTYIMLPSDMSLTNKNSVTDFLNMALDCHLPVTCDCQPHECDATTIPATHGSDTGGFPFDNE